MDKEKDVTTISYSDEIFARKLALYLDENSNVSDNVQARLDNARLMAVASMKKGSQVNEAITVSEEEKESVALWFKKHYATLSNNVVALALVVLAVPISMNVVDFDSPQKERTTINKVVSADDLYLENTYHMNADNLDDDYLEDMGFI